MKVVVIGGGAIGLCCAHFLRRGGAEVCVVDRGACGQATSWGNAGWITRMLSEPLPAPGVITQALKWMVKPESPFLVRPRMDRDFYRWSWRFARHCSAEQHRRGTEALVALNAATLDLFDELRDDGVQFEMHETGLLFLALTEPEILAYASAMRAVQAAGHDEPFEVLDRASVRNLEPSVSEHVIGGIYVPSERHVFPESLTSGLAAALAGQGVTLLENTEVLSLAFAATKRAWRLRTTGDELAADAVVVAGGIWSTALLDSIGVHVPLEAAKGYSITVDRNGRSPRHALYLMEAKVGCTPFADSVRVAGTLELAGIDVTMNHRRIAPLLRAASTYLADWNPGAGVPWAGLRAVPPDGLPIIGGVPGRAGLYVATGHSHLGITLAPATGAGLARMVLEDRVPQELAPFRLERDL